MKSFEEYLSQSLSYPQYRELGQELLSQNKTSGPDQSPEMIEYTQLNDHRAERILKKGIVFPETKDALAGISKPLTLLALTELWCGDAAQNLPWIHLMTENHPSIQFRLVFRDEHPELMDAFLTNGARAIPKVIVLDENLAVCSTWGPRPEPAQAIILENKKTGALPKEELYKNLHLWYALDKGRHVQSEITSLLAGCAM